MIVIEHMKLNHISEVKYLADTNRDSLGFNTRRKFEEVVEQSRGMVAIDNNDVIGFVIYRHRKIDNQTTLSEICVHQGHRGRRIGEQLLSALIHECETKSRVFIQLKCPIDLPANKFYKQSGFELFGTEQGKKRPLNVWRLFLPYPQRDEV